MANQAQFFEPFYGDIDFYFKIKSSVWGEQESFIQQNFINDSNNSVSISLILQFLRHNHITNLDRGIAVVFTQMLELLFPKLWKYYQPVIQSITIAPAEHDMFLQYMAFVFFDWASKNGIDQIRGVPIQTLRTESAESFSGDADQLAKFQRLVPTLTIKEN